MSTPNRVLRSLSVFLAAGLFCFFAVPKARAMGAHQEIYFTVNNPVQVPGHVIEPGKYLLRLVHPTDNLDIVQLINSRTSQSLGLFLTQPTHRLRATSKPVVKLQESNSGYAIPAITKWFYPGNHTGRKFIYTPAEQELMSRLAEKSHSARG